MATSVSQNTVPVCGFESAILGIGVSTETLEELRDFLPLIPADAPFSIIIFMTDRDSGGGPDLAALAETSGISVHMASGGEQLQPGHALLVPPGMSCAIEGKRLRLWPAHPRARADLFFRAIAEAAGNCAIGLMLGKGGGGEGAAGLKAIADAGGLTGKQPLAMAAILEHLAGVDGPASLAGAVGQQALIERLTRELAQAKAQLEEVRELREEDSLDLENLIGTTAVATLYLTREGLLRRVNGAAAVLLGIGPEQMGRKLERVPGWPGQLSIDEAFGDRAEAPSVEHAARLEDGRWILHRLNPFRRRDGSLGGALLTSADVSIRKVAEEEAGRSIRMLTDVMRAVPGVIYVKDRQGRFLLANRGTEELIGQPAAEFLGRTDLEALGQKERALAVMATDRRIMEQGHGEQLEEDIPLPDGTEARWLSVKEPLRDSAGAIVGLIGSSIDITGRHRLETALRQAELRLEAVLNSTRMSLFVTDRQQNCIYANSAAEALTGLPGDDMRGRPLHDLLHHHRPDGSACTSEDCPVAAAFASDHRVQAEDLFIHRDGGFYPVAFTVSPLRDEAKGGDGSIVEVRNIAEEKARDAALADALQAKDMLLHEVNHRVKNSLQLVTSLLMLQASQAQDAQLRQRLMEARGRISVVAAMHQRLYSTSQHDRVDFGDYLRELARNTMESLEDGERIQLQLDIPEGRVLLLTQAVPLALVVSELLANAIKYAFPDHGPGIVSVRMWSEGDELGIEVADNGRGLPDGFSVEGSSGLGMKIVHALTKQVRAKLDVISGEQGCAFRIIVPHLLCNQDPARRIDAVLFSNQ